MLMLIKLDINLLDKWYVGTLFTNGFLHAHIRARTRTHIDSQQHNTTQCKRAYSLSLVIRYHSSFEYRCLLKLKGTDNRFL